MADFQKLLGEGAKQMGLQLSPAAVERLTIYQQLLDKWAPRINLTAVRDMAGMVERLFLDSAVLVPQLQVDHGLHDVGSGAGFPGLVIKSLLPELQVTLSEARRKRVSFLTQAARQMGLEHGLDIRWQRLELDSGQEQDERWAQVVSRATFPPNEWIAKGATLLNEGGWLWLMVSDSKETQSELQQGRDSWPSNLQLAREIAYTLPFCGQKRRLLAFVKH